MNASQINWERVWGPWLGLLGAVFLFVGISAPDQKFGNIPMAHIADGVGVAAFLFSMSNIIERLKKGQETSSMQSRKDTLTLLEENRELNRRLSEALAASNGALMELLERDLSATRRVWDCTSSLYDLTETTFKLRTQESYVVRVSGTMIENVVRRCTSKLARDIRTVLEGSEFSLEIRDFSPVTEYLEALVAALPENSCWLGLSRLTLPGAWEADLSSRAEWNSTLLAKASDKKVVVCRVWILDSASDIRLIENEMRQQSEKGVVARYYVAGPGDDLRNTQDMSLIWTPGVTGAEMCPVEFDMNPVAALRDGGYRRMQGLVFDVNSGIYLTSMRIVTPDQTHVNQQAFSQIWAKAVSLPQLAIAR